MSVRLKTSLWVEAHQRLCFARDMPAFVIAKGDLERGGVILKINRFKNGISLYEQTLDFNGNKMWRLLGEYSAADEENADAAAAKKRSYDPDVWLIEVEDGRSQYELDAPISDF